MHEDLSEIQCPSCFEWFSFLLSANASDRFSG